MKSEKPSPNLDDIELLPDATERLERLTKAFARQGPIPKETLKKGKRATSSRRTRGSKPVR